MASLDELLERPRFRYAFWTIVLSFFALFTLLYAGLTVPIAIGLLLAYISQPVAEFTETKWRWPRMLTAMVVLGVFCLSLVLFVMWLGPPLVEQSQQIVKKLPKYMSALETQWDIDLDLVLKERGIPVTAESIDNAVLDNSKQVWQFLRDAFQKTSFYTLSVFIVGTVWFGMIIHLPAVIALIRSFIPRSQRQSSDHLARKVDDAFDNFFRGRLIIAGIMICLFAAGWYLADVPYWIVFGFIAGIISIVPYVSLAVVPAVVAIKYLEIVQNPNLDATWLQIFGWPVLVYAVVQFVEGWILTPWIQGDKLDLNPITVIIVVILGGEMAGILGMILAIPVAAAVKIISEDAIIPPIQKWARRN